MESKLKLELEGLHRTHPGLTASLAGSYCEAAAVVFCRHHTPPFEIEIVDSGGTVARRVVSLSSPDPRAQAANANANDAITAAAYCVSLAAVEDREQLVAVGRAETGTGADWYVAPRGHDREDLEDCYRLEVSGVESGDMTRVRGRLKQKVAQTRKGVSNVPALASVVGFKERYVVIEAAGELP